MSNPIKPKKPRVRVVASSVSTKADSPPVLTADEQWLLRSYRELNPKMQGFMLKFAENMTEKFGKQKTTSLRLIQGGAQ